MTLLRMQRRGGNPFESDFEEGVSNLFNFSPSSLALAGTESRSTRLLPSEHRSFGPPTGAQSPSLPGYPIPTDAAAWGDYVLPTSGTFSAPAPSPQSRSMADDIGRHLNYFAAYSDPSVNLDNSVGSGSYAFGPAGGPSTSASSGVSNIRQLQNDSYIPTSQTSYLGSQSSIPTAVMSQTGHLDMISTPDTRQTFFSPDGCLYDLGTSVQDVLPMEPGMLQPSLSFSLPGIPSAEEAFLSQFNESTAGIGEPLVGESQQDLFSSEYRPSLGLLSHPTVFGTEEHDLEHNLYHTHLGTGSPSTSESSRASQKRLRDQVELQTSTPGLHSDDWSIASRVKRQRVNRTGDSANSAQSKTPQKKVSSVSSPFSFGSGDGEENDIFDSGNDDSDAYVPSRSSSPILPTAMFTSPSPPSESTPITEKVKRGKRKGKGKAKGSAARALAILTRAREQQDSMGVVELGYTEATVRDGHSGVSSAVGGTIDGSNDGESSRAKRISLPVPVPNLIKKSRGRKVPYVPSLRGGEGVGEGVPVTGVVTLRPSGRRGRRRGGAAGGRDLVEEQEHEFGHVQTPSAEERTFVCMIPGCGKCFVRGEHLKRHVRSIHTDDKPHVCPYKGCGKSFSRRDNLGQHVRVHMDQ